MTEEIKFVPFPKLPRLARGIIITEKIDGTNASIYISDDSQTVLAGSRTRWVTVGDDNFGFAGWVEANRAELLKLGPGHHFGEWWGIGIQRGYGIFERRFSLFNVKRWGGDESGRPACCHVVPVLGRFDMNTMTVDQCLADLEKNGSSAAPGFMKPEGIVIYHQAANMMFKRTIEKDASGKGE
jgi:hypothetical protein